MGIEDLLFLSKGLLIYAILNASGYYAQLGNIAMIIMFSIILISAINLLIINYKEFNQK